MTPALSSEVRRKGVTVNPISFLLQCDSGFSAEVSSRSGRQEYVYPFLLQCDSGLSAEVSWEPSVSTVLHNRLQCDSGLPAEVRRTPKCGPARRRKIFNMTPAG